MRHLRRYLPPLVVLLPLIFICGKLLLTPVWDHHRSPFDSPSAERGWPWVFQAIDVDFEGEYTMVQGLFDAAVDGWPLAADVAVLFLVFAGCVAILVLHYRRMGGWFRISLRELFVLSTVLCVVIGWSVHNWVDAKRKQLAIEELSDHRIYERGVEQYHGPQWIRRFVANEDLAHFYFDDGLIIPAAATDEAWRAIEQTISKLPHVRRLSVNQGAIRIHDWTTLQRIESVSFSYATDGHLVGIEQLPNMKVLSLSSARIGSAGLGHIANCACLKWIWMSGEEIDNDGLALLGKLSQLQRLGLAMTNADDSGVAHLSAITSLRTLHLEGCRAGDDCLIALQRLPHLEFLDLAFLPITDAGARHLLRFPSLKSLTLHGPHRVSEETLELLKQKMQVENLGSRLP